MSESRVRENRTHGSMRRREATPDQSAKPRGPRTPPADPTLRGSDMPDPASRREWVGSAPPTALSRRVALFPALLAKEKGCENPASANLQASGIVGRGDQFAELAAVLAAGD